MIYDDICIWIHDYVHGADRRWILCITNSYYMLWLEPMFSEFLLFEPLNTGTVVLFWTTPVPSEFEEHLFYIIDAVRETCSLCWGETFQVLTFALIYLLQFRHVWSPVTDHQCVFILSELYQNQGLIDMIFLIDGSDFSAFVVFFKQVHSSIEQGMRGLGYYRDPKQDIGGVKGVWGLSEKRSVDTVYGIWCYGKISPWKLFFCSFKCRYSWIHRCEDIRYPQDIRTVS